MKKPVIEVSHLSKQYTISHLQKDSYVTFKDELVRFVKKPLQLIGSAHGMEKEKFWALKDINFEVRPGEVVGIIGRNGSGKSTLFKILSRITHPTEGRAVLHGKTASLLEVGTGFNPELTGRENIYFNGAILGMRKREIDQKFDSIVGFSEVEKFIDTQVKYYSSGMKVRLGFSVAAHLDPEILLIDEVLAVGDAEFKRKSLKKMQEIAGRGTTILFVSHVMTQVQKICSRGILLNQGRIAFEGSVDEVTDLYLGQSQEVYDEDKQLFGSTTDYLILNQTAYTDVSALSQRQGNGQIKFKALKFEIAKQAGGTNLRFSLRLAKQSLSFHQDLRVVLSIFDLLGNEILVVSNTQPKIKKPIATASNQSELELGITLKNINIAPGAYRIKLNAANYTDSSMVYDQLRDFAEFRIPNYDTALFSPHDAHFGLVALPVEYEVQ